VTPNHADASTPTAADQLRDRVRGAVLEPGDPGYDEARSVWNARIDRRPRAVLRCRGAADVVAGVEIAGERDLPVSVKGGGHHVSGSAVVEDGLTLDMAAMDWVRVDPEGRTATVGPGATWGQVDRETQAFGLAVPGGQDPNIGVAGLTLGGGVGWLSRKYGLTCDNLRQADVVTADGDLIRASETEHEELFWALRGAGGAFGVVTAFEFDLHAVGPEVLAGSLIYPPGETASVARRYRAFVSDAPREVRLLFGSMVLPDASVYPAAVRGERVAIVVTCYAGPPAEGRPILAPLRAFGDPVMDSIRPRAYADFQRAGDSEGSMRTFLRSQYAESLSDGGIETITEHAGAAPSAGATVFVSPRSGAETDLPTDATAYPHREDAHHVLVEARWTDPDRDDEHVAWVRRFHDALSPYTTGEVAANFLTDDERPSRARAAYGENAERLRRLKAAWDPERRFAAGAPIEPEPDA